MQFEEYELIIARAPINIATLGDQELQQNRIDHAQFMTSLRERGITVANGNVIQASAGDFESLAIIATGSLEESRNIAEQDPAVLAGRRLVDVVTWRCFGGIATIKGRPGTS